MFDGINGYWWSILACRFWDARGTPEGQRLEEVPSAFSGRSSIWFRLWRQRNPLADWDSFDLAFLHQFLPDMRPILLEICWNEVEEWEIEWEEMKARLLQQQSSQIDHKTTKSESSTEQEIATSSLEIQEKKEEEEDHFSNNKSISTNPESSELRSKITNRGSNPDSYQDGEGERNMDLQETAEKIPDLEISNLQPQLNRENSDLICGEALMDVDGNNEVLRSSDEGRTTTLLVSTAVFGIFLATTIGVNSYKYKATTATTISRDREEAPTMHEGKGDFRWVTEGLGELALDSRIEGEEERGVGSAVMMREWPPPKPPDHEVADTAEEEASAEIDDAGTVMLSESLELLSMDKEGFMLVKPCEVTGIARKKKESNAATPAMRGTDKAPTVTLENPWRCGDRQVLGPRASGDWALRGVVDFPYLLCMLLHGEVSAEVRKAAIEEIAGERVWKGKDHNYRM